MSVHRLPSFIDRVGENLEQVPLADLMRLASVVMEFVRGLLVKNAPEDLRAELDEMLKPFIRELLTRGIELETLPPSRGQG